MTLLAGARVFDPETGETTRADVRLDGSRIAEVGPGLDGDERVDCSGGLLIPGLIDCHVHVAFRRPESLPRSARILEAVPVLRRLLARGITTVRDAWGADAGFKHALRKGGSPDRTCWSACVSWGRPAGSATRGTRPRAPSTTTATRRCRTRCSTGRTPPARPCAGWCARAPTGSRSARAARCGRSVRAWTSARPTTSSPLWPTRPAAAAATCWPTRTRRRRWCRRPAPACAASSTARSSTTRRHGPGERLVRADAVADERHRVRRHAPAFAAPRGGGGRPDRGRVPTSPRVPMST